MGEMFSAMLLNMSFTFPWSTFLHAFLLQWYRWFHVKKNLENISLVLNISCSIESKAFNF